MCSNACSYDFFGMWKIHASIVIWNNFIIDSHDAFDCKLSMLKQYAFNVKLFLNSSFIVLRMKNHLNIFIVPDAMQIGYQHQLNYEDLFRMSLLIGIDAVFWRTSLCWIYIMKLLSLLSKLGNNLSLSFLLVKFLNNISFF